MRRIGVVLVILAACGGSHPAPKAPPPPEDAKPAESTQKQLAPEEAQKVGVALTVEPPEAEVTIDDLVVGKAAELDPVFALAPGLHTLTVKQAGYKTYRMEFSVTDKTETFTIHLEKTPKSR